MSKTTPKRSSAEPSEPASYEVALAELESLVAEMDGGQLPLEQLLERYRRGAHLLAYCRARLDAVEHQIRVFEEGDVKPWTPPQA